MSELEGLIARFAAGTMSRRVFVSRLLALGIGIDFVETLLGPGARRALAAPQRIPIQAPYVVVVVMDAFRADYASRASMPNLSWLMEQGTYFPRAWVGQLESFTPASHATIGTGATPSRHGVIGFTWRDPTSGKETYTGWWQGVMQGRLEAQLSEHNVNSLAAVIKDGDPAARVIAVSSDKYYAADAVGGPAADYILFSLAQGNQVVTKGVPHHQPQHFLNHAAPQRPRPLKYEDFDAMAMDIALASLRLRPRVLLINLPGADVYGHKVGGPATPDVMKRIAEGADQQLGRLLQTYRERNLLEQTIFVVTGDHGMVQNDHQIMDTDLKQAIRAADGDYLFHTGGSAAYIWLGNTSNVASVAQKLVDTVPNASIAHYQQLKAGQYTYYPVTRTGTDPAADIATAYQYLHDTFSGPISPDITLFFQENTIIRNAIDGPPIGVHGNHGGASWGDQHIPLVIAGPGIRRGVESNFPARLMDIAPTILNLLGLQADRMDGIVLANTLFSPDPNVLRLQDDLAPTLTSYQQAIIARSQ